MTGVMSTKKSGSLSDDVLFVGRRTVICFTSNSAPSGWFDIIPRLQVDGRLANGCDSEDKGCLLLSADFWPCTDTRGLGVTGECKSDEGELRSCVISCSVDWDEVSRCDLNFIADDGWPPPVLLKCVFPPLSPRLSEWLELVNLDCCATASRSVCNDLLNCSDEPLSIQVKLFSKSFNGRESLPRSCCVKRSSIESPSSSITSAASLSSSTAV